MNKLMDLINFKNFITDRINKPIILHYATKGGLYQNEINGKCKEVNDEFTIFHINGGRDIRVDLSQIKHIDESWH